MLSDILGGSKDGMVSQHSQNMIMKSDTEGPRTSSGPGVYELYKCRDLYGCLTESHILTFVLLGYCRV